MVCRLLERCQHQYAVFHLCNTETRDAKDLSLYDVTSQKTPSGTEDVTSAYLVSHDVAKQHDVPRVDTHAVLFHDELDFVDDVAPSRLDAKDCRSLNYMVRSSMFPDNA